ncbi:3-deoxy-7-phosphoheptulonate synthase [Paraeggerthella hongkongensis]|uniref:Phospho-2-dehydro-3-deoxyheptonate aldolase n=1 Tax=Paraeggerthella hongkongensis TaxID=230658 RepID=A0A3N0BDW1_9ACTN|nr:3-deoxy-7-phosphoheptulonate synthase [Paraeggerthella hongkongensis]RNL45761.1 3-deoxy-7-phosphoheptulonate synthase [Paraeggerthella hongkongensis]
MTMEFRRRLPIPAEVKEDLPLPSRYEKKKAERDWEIGQILQGVDATRKLLVIGPCSADRSDAVLEYCAKLAELQEKVKDKLLIIPRIYTSKPRTTGAGYKGMLHQPNPSSGSDMLEGLKTIRSLHLKVIQETNLFGADEMLYPSSYRFVSDLLSYAAVGARSVENQEHRLTASGLDIPVGMKNPTGGDISVMINAVYAAQQGHMFIYRNWEVVTSGNPLAHAILRGYKRSDGRNRPNYHYEDLLLLCEEYSKMGLKNPSVVIDCNHANSNKKHVEQPRIVRDVLRSCSESKEVSTMIKGFMVESYLEEGSQKVGGSVYGKSITDPCLGWSGTERLILELADEL